MVEFRLVAFIFRIGGFGLAVLGGSMAGHRSSIERVCVVNPKTSEFLVFHVKMCHLSTSPNQEGRIR